MTELDSFGHYDPSKEMEPVYSQLGKTLSSKNMIENE